MTDTQATNEQRDRADDGIIEVDGRKYMRDARGRLTPLDLVRPQDQLQDEMVRRIVGFAEDLSARIGRFRGHTMDDIGAFDELLSAEYGGHARTSVKGNRTYISFDGTLKVQVQVSERVAFGPELQVARELVDECLAEWSTGTNDQLRAVVNHAFAVDKEGEIGKTEIYRLLRLEIDDERWKQAMAAVHHAMRVIGSKSYVRIYRRGAPDEAWQPITIDLAKAAS